MSVLFLVAILFVSFGAAARLSGGGDPSGDCELCRDEEHVHR